MMKGGKMTNSDKKNEEDSGHELSEEEIEEAIEEGKKVALDEDLLDDNMLDETNSDILAAVSYTHLTLPTTPYV